MHLKEILAREMKERHLTLTKLSRETKIPKQTIHNWLCGTEPRSLTQLRILAKYFGMSIEGLCFLDVVKECLPSCFESYRNEIYAGEFEVILRKVK